ncbi:hypothetical protein ASF18_03770 [Methylobacterium sp. Leaf89]|nr:hypothetical protein ASF18_03770 [Methylobacterium sp. Leaf89]
MTAARSGRLCSMQRNCRRLSICPCERWTLATPNSPRSITWLTRSNIAPAGSSMAFGGVAKGVGLQTARPWMRPGIWAQA